MRDNGVSFFGGNPSQNQETRNSRLDEGGSREEKESKTRLSLRQGRGKKKEASDESSSSKVMAKRKNRPSRFYFLLREGFAEKERGRLT